jgi:hypothetical protein
MKTHGAFVILILLFPACSEKKDKALPLLEVSAQDWAIFEGNIVSDQGEIIEVELSLKESSPGLPSFYRFNGIVVTDHYTAGGTSDGEYEVTQLGNGLFGIRLLNVKTGQPFSANAFFKRNIPRLRTLPVKPYDYRTSDFYFITNGDGRLILADDDFNRISTDDRYTVFKRSSLFTVEGYVTLEPDSSLEFFERNTFEDWHVAHLGLYSDVRKNYTDLAKEPWEGIYVRALAYSVSDTTDGREHHGNLVVKKLIAMGDSQYP